MQLGSVQITRIEDYHGPGLAPEFMFPAIDAKMWEDAPDWARRFVDLSANRLLTSIHSWLVRTPHHTVLIDSCIGNHKERPHVPHFNMRDAPWLQRLQAAGVQPEEVDFVMCTHLHADHVGWNTRLQDGRWVPTFPNAKYLFSQTEFDSWDARRPDYVARPFNQCVFEDSILPVVEAGQVQFVEEGYGVDDVLSVESAPGHTAGSVKIRVSSQGSEGMFSGDVIHHPLQLHRPDLCSSFDEDQGTALQTRIRMLDDCAARGSLLMPTHFAAPFCCRITGHDHQGGYLPDWNV
ncbi:MBL fold metallo-hydrolase [Paraburkholderia sp. ZP32-5]|uniref:MBL fold metallo-hydrolase n=1 Tax=Paraburkholderia sp. ZP32-5 TaxID=2883245 RepID=UPI001F1DD5C6|nr:MBL fold metallo-hydrolase [Paraburkholderia sp. ZP32-5]